MDGCHSGGEGGDEENRSDVARFVSNVSRRGGACDAARRQAKAAKWPSLIKRDVVEAEATDKDSGGVAPESTMFCGIASCVVPCGGGGGD